MDFTKLIERKRTAILKKWLDGIYHTYPADTARFLKSEKDMFANPVGHTIAANAEYLLEGLIRGDDTASMSAYLDWIIRIRAVQDFTATQAVAFISMLKTLILDQLKTDIRRHNLWEEWQELVSRIDDLTLMSFEIYSRMKQRMHDIRTRELEKSEKFLIRLMEKGSR